MNAVMQIFLCIIVNIVLAIVSANADFSTKVSIAIDDVDTVINRIYQAWQIDKYPNFLKSCSMSKHSWNLMKAKLKMKILAAASTQISQKFVICFTGSSVTAGHDSPFNKSFGPLVGEIMEPVLRALDVRLEQRTVAIGNNPCFPYDICVRTFCGNDADLVHWEQTYFGSWGSSDHDATLEQFIRQAMAMPTKPIVVFAASETINWVAKDCPNPIVPYTLTEDDKTLLKTPAHRVASELNERETQIPPDVSKAYRSVGLQHWIHYHYHDKYQCQGPYHKDWGEGCVSWHPSLSGHQLRADHHAYFWLSVWRDALTELRLSLATPSTTTATTPNSLLANVTRHMHRMTSHPMPAKPLFHTRTNVSDKIQCFTDFEPRTFRNASLSGTVLSGVRTAEGKAGWAPRVMEQLWMRGEFHSMIRKHTLAGYLDYKRVLVADSEAAGPLSLRIQPTAAGVVYICQHRTNEVNFWELEPLLFIHSDVVYTDFVFDRSSAKPLTYFHVTATGGGSGEGCVQTDERLEAGNHALTIVPTHKPGRFLVVATILVP